MIQEALVAEVQIREDQREAEAEATVRTARASQCPEGREAEVTVVAASQSLLLKLRDKDQILDQRDPHMM